MSGVVRILFGPLRNMRHVVINEKKSLETSSAILFSAVMVPAVAQICLYSLLRPRDSAPLLTLELMTAFRFGRQHIDIAFECQYVHPQSMIECHQLLRVRLTDLIINR
jgi:hypothetical protein